MRIFRDPIHDLISIDKNDSFIQQLISTKEFQRLRRIKQLGLANLVFPGAEHSRFVHSLGVFNFARRMIANLLRHHGEDSEIGKDLNEYQNAIKAAALLHDLGHGPFSHVFERVFDPPDSIDHERWTCNILLDRETEVNQCLNALKIDPALVTSLISDEAPMHPPQPFLKDIVSSQLDADRMDYLLRDSAMTGSRFGSYDPEWILNALAIGEISFGQTQLRKLCLDASKGTGAIEGLLFARRLMTKFVYSHKTTRAYENELLCTLRLAAEYADRLPPETPEPVVTILKLRGDVRVKDYLLLDDDVTWWALRRWAVLEPPNGDEHLQALQRHALRLVRRKKPWTSVEVSDERALSARILIKELQQNDSPLVFECYFDGGEFLPYKNLEHIASKDPDDEQAYFQEIYLLDGDSPQRFSTVVEPQINYALTEKARLSRFYYDREFEEDFTGLLQKYGIC